MNKYHNIKTRGFDSKKEYRYSRDLELLKRVKEIKNWKPQVRYDLYAKNGAKVCYMRVDFEIINKEGKKEVHEVKSNATKTAIWALKKKLFEDNYPDIGYKIIN